MAFPGALPKIRTLKRGFTVHDLFLRQNAFYLIDVIEWFGFRPFNSKEFFHFSTDPGFFRVDVKFNA